MGTSRRWRSFVSLTMTRPATELDVARLRHRVVVLDGPPHRVGYDRRLVGRGFRRTRYLANLDYDGFSRPPRGFEHVDEGRHPFVDHGRVRDRSSTERSRERRPECFRLFNWGALVH